MSDDWDGYGSRIVWAMHNPDAMDKDGMATLIYPGQRKGRVRFGHPTPARRRARRREGRVVRLRRQRRLRRDETWTRYLLARIDRETQLREIERILDELVASGEMVKNPDGSYQKKPPTLVDKLHDRRREARGTQHVSSHVESENAS
jgi:hypothetical protein